MLWNEPEKYIEMISGFIKADPTDHVGYFSRHQAWVRVGRLDKALDDIDRAIALNDSVIGHLSRGKILSSLGRYQEALADFNRAEELDPAGWVDCWGPLYRADCRAWLGQADAALADCARLPEDFFSPGLSGTPSGNKAQITAAIRQRAAGAHNGS